MLTTIGSLKKPMPNKNNGSRSAFNRNNNSRPASKKKDGNNEVDGFDGNSVKYGKKSGKSKSQKLANSQKLSKSGKLKSEKFKKLSKSGNLPNFDITEARLSFPTLDATTTFNHLRLVFTKASILQYYDLKCHI